MTKSDVVDDISPSRLSAAMLEPVYVPVLFRRSLFATSAKSLAAFAKSVANAATKNETAAMRLKPLYPGAPA